MGVPIRYQVLNGEDLAIGDGLKTLISISHKVMLPRILIEIWRMLTRDIS